MANFVVFHIEKGTQATGGLTNHLDRNEESRDHSFPQADKSRQHLNKDVELGYTGSITERRAKRMSEGYTCGKTIRKDAVPHLSIVLSGTNEQMKLIESKGMINQWVEDNQIWLQKEFGEKNLVKLTLHMDEKTPHLHAIIVPLQEDGTLSAKKAMGNPIKMQQRQTSYAEAMLKYGLERGFLGSKATHEGEKEYRSRVENTEERVFSKTDAIFRPEKIKEVFEENKALKTEVKALKHKIQKDRGTVAEANKFLEFLKLFKNPVALYNYAREIHRTHYNKEQAKIELSLERKKEEIQRKTPPKNNQGLQR